jgi:hypothetical protein
MRRLSDTSSTGVTFWERMGFAMLGEGPWPEEPEWVQTDWVDEL